MFTLHFLFGVFGLIVEIFYALQLIFSEVLINNSKENRLIKLGAIHCTLQTCCRRSVRSLICPSVCMNALISGFTSANDIKFGMQAADGYSKVKLI